MNLILNNLLIQGSQTSYKQRSLEKSKIEEKTNITPELPLSNNIDHEISFMDTLKPIRTSYPFQDQII